MPASTNDVFLAVSRHPTYYIQGADLSFLIEHIQFRVHRYFFERESLYFRNYLTVPASPGAVRTGVNDSNAIVLEEVKPAEFELFLWVFYNPRYSLYNRTVEEWEIILKLAHRWTFPEVKNLAVRQLEKLEFPDLDRIAIYQENAVDRRLLVPCFARLCEREEPLTLPEGMKLGMETTLMIACAREVSRGSVSPTGARSPTSAHVHGNELHAIVCDLFKIEPQPETPNGDEKATTPLPGTKEPKTPVNTSATSQASHQEDSNKVNGTAKGKGSKENGDTSNPEDETNTPTGDRPNTPSRGGKGNRGGRGGKGRGGG